MQWSTSSYSNNTSKNCRSYYVFGALLPGRSGGSNDTRYGFNGMEKDNELYGDNNSYDFGARMYNPRLGRWMSTDPLSQEYPSLSTYCFVGNMPIVAKDPDGERIIFVNGYNNQRSWWPGTGSNKRAYWSEKFIQGARTFFGEIRSDKFVDGRGTWNSSGSERYDAGYEYAKANLSTITEGMVEGETIKVVSHSMGGAYSEGMIKYLIEQGYTVEKVVHLSPADADDFKAHTKPKTLQLSLENDAVLGWKDFFNLGVYNIEGTDASGVVDTDDWWWTDAAQSHNRTRTDPDVWKMVRDLETVSFKKERPYYDRAGMGYNYNFGIPEQKGYVYKSTGNKNGTEFNSVTKGGNTYEPAPDTSGSGSYIECED